MSHKKKEGSPDHVASAQTNTITTKTKKSSPQENTKSSPSSPEKDSASVREVSNNEDNSDNFNNDPEKKDAIPLLIIDVNIRPGVKKKIYVFDGDTAEGLAEKFAQEHSKKIILYLLKNILKKFMLYFRFGP